MEVRDRLAIERTHLANERTLLAYIRTALALAAAGAAIIQFIDTPRAATAGWILIACGVVILPVAVSRFMNVRNRLGDTSGVDE